MWVSRLRARFQGLQIQWLSWPLRAHGVGWAAPRAHLPGQRLPRTVAPNLPQGAVAGVTEGALGAGPQGARRSSLGRGVENSPGSHGRLRHQGAGRGPVRTGTGGVGAVGTGRT